MVVVRRVLLTGANGRVAQQLLPGLAGYDLRLLDREQPGGACSLGVLAGEMTDRLLLAAAVEGVDAVVHLAADPRPDAAWDELQPSNVDAFAALLGAAAQHGVRRVVYASSIHAMGRYEWQDDVPVHAEWPTAPCCVYGASKVFDEALAAVVAARTAVSTIGLRLGATVERPTHRNQLGAWLGPEDLRHLVVQALQVDVHCGVFPGVSANTRSRWDLGSARAALGYHPVLDSEDFAAGVEPGTTITACPSP